MNIDELPFKIGMQYENWEFDLDIIETERYDKYKYNKNDIDTLFELAIQDVFLTFDLDILFKVEIVFKTKSQNIVSMLIEDIKYSRSNIGQTF